MALTDKLVAIANAIRGKTGKEDTLSLEQMATEIDGIEVPINLDEEIATQDDLIAQIQAMLEGKAAGGGSGNSKPIFESIVTDKIENHIVSAFSFTDIVETSLIEEIEEG